MNEELQVWLAQAIRAEAAAKGLNIRQLGIRAGVADKVLRRSLDNERPFWLSNLVRVADALGVSVSYLVAEAERRRGMDTTGADPVIVEQVLAETDTLTAKQKSAIRKQVTDGNTQSGRGSQGRSVIGSGDAARKRHAGESSPFG